MNFKPILRVFAFLPLLLQSCSDPLPTRRASLRQYDESDSFEAIFISDTAPSAEVREHDVWMTTDYSVVRRFENGKWEEICDFYRRNKAILHCLDLGEEPARFARAFVRTATASNISWHETLEYFPGVQDGSVPRYDTQPHDVFIFSMHRNADRYELKKFMYLNNPYGIGSYHNVSYAWRGEDGEPHFCGIPYGANKEFSFVAEGSIGANCVLYASFAIPDLIVDVREEGGVYRAETEVEETGLYLGFGPKEGAASAFFRYSITSDGRYLEYMNYRVEQPFTYEEYDVRATMSLQSIIYFYDIHSTPWVEIPDSYLEYEAGTMQPPISDGGGQQ